MVQALMLVDLQEDYLGASGLQPARGALVAQAAALLEGWRVRGWPVIHAWTTTHDEPDDRMPHWREAGRRACVEGAPGHASPLVPAPGEAIVHKRFFSAFEDPGLERLLADLRPERLVIAGLHLHACVRATALDAYARGYAITIVDDAAASDDPIHAAITRRYLAARCARFAPTSAVLGVEAPSVHHAPADGAPLWTLPTTSPEAIHEAVERAGRAWPAWARLPHAARQEALQRVAERVFAARDRLVAALVRDIGKPVSFAHREVDMAARFLRAAAAEPPGGAVDRPHGVVALVTPFNNPLAVPLGKLGPAWLYGNGVVWKPAPAGARVADEVARLVADELPAGLLGVAHGGSDVAAALMGHPGVDAVTLTGGPLAGAAAQEICARRMVPLQAELGGNNAVIVARDADLDDAARCVAAAAFGFAGQRCTATRRVIVGAERAAALVTSLERATAALPWGDPARAETVVGPLISRAAMERVRGALRRSPGARHVVPHGPDPRLARGWFVPPTIVLGLAPDDELVQEETFGPVLVVQDARDDAHALALCDGVRQGLVASLFSRDPALQDAFFARVRAGVLKLNQATTDVAPGLPFGGWKASGVGPPEHGDGDRQFYTRPQARYRGPGG